MSQNVKSIQRTNKSFNEDIIPKFITDENNILKKIIIPSECTLDTDSLSSKEIIEMTLRWNLQLIPIVDEEKRFIQSIRKYSLNKIAEEIYVKSKAPAKISFAGGGTDFTDYTVSGKKGRVLSCAINLFSHCTLEVNTSDKVIINTEGKEKDIFIKDLHSTSTDCEDFGLIVSVLKFIDLKQGARITISTDFPKGSGLGGSSSVTVSLLTAFNELQKVKWTKIEVVYTAFLCERIIFNLSGGWQDQYISAMGGLNEITLSSSSHIINKITQSHEILDTLGRHLIITDTGVSRNSGSVLDSQRKSINTNAPLLHYLERSKNLIAPMIKNLLTKNYENFSKNLMKSGKMKIELSKNEVPTNIIEILSYAKSIGIQSSRLLGAGQGGHLLFFVCSKKRDLIIKQLNDKGFSSKKISIYNEGASANTYSKFG